MAGQFKANVLGGQWVLFGTSPQNILQYEAEHEHEEFVPNDGWKVHLEPDS